jgi:hypothetical protein
VSCTELGDELVLAVVRSGVAGRVVETIAPGRSYVEVDLGDGRVEGTGTNVAPTGLFPLPGWPRWGRKVRYEPYG